MCCKIWRLFIWGLKVKPTVVYPGLFSVTVPKRGCALFIQKDFFAVKTSLINCAAGACFPFLFTHVDSALLVLQFLLPKFLLATDHKLFLHEVETRINKITTARDAVNSYQWINCIIWAIAKDTQDRFLTLLHRCSGSHVRCAKRSPWQDWRELVHTQKNPGLVDSVNIRL